MTTITEPVAATASGGSGTEHHRIVIVGTGFSGLGAAIKLIQAGERDFIVLERAADVGGTWRDNTYPGCRCDVPSHLYSFSFAPNPDWSTTYSPQPEIWAYLRRTADQHGVRPHIRWGREVLDASWDDTAGRWTVTTGDGSFSADYLILGTGALVEPNLPDIEGLDQFGGRLIHTARWQADYDPTGERVAVIGTGASSIQVVPAIQPQVSSLVLFQRTPAWVMPHTGRKVKPWERRLFRALPFTQRAVRTAVYWTREMSVLAFVKYPRLMKLAEKQALKHLAAQVPDAAKRAKLTPHYDMGCKRVLPSNDFYPAVAQPNVSLETAGIARVTERGIVGADGVEHEVDTIIFGTGFHVTDNPMAGLVHGRDGHTLAEVFESPEYGAYLGTTIPFFPNLFMMTGPNTGLGHTSMVFMIESQLAYVMDAFAHLGRTDVFEVKPEVAAAYNAELQAQLPETVWGSGCASWYLDKNGRNITLWPSFTFTYRRRTRRFRMSDFTLRRARVPAAG